jgi:lipopolysaccharide transport system ATP-binding protein
MSDIAIQFENVGKLYHLGTVGTGTLSHDLNRWWQTKVLRKEDPYLKVGETNDRAHRGNSDFVWALRDITFDVKQGEVVGIIGKNGAGKSTLLKLLSRVTAPTTGVIRARGRIASLLEVGTGFHQEMTGRENIYMNGAIMGMTRAEITRKLDEIVDFAGVERYLDTPVKRYSSGMTVRLGFAVAAFLEPEILVVDEVLAVGDAEFQKKAIGKMQDVSRGEGRTVLFVSHNMAAVRSLCQRGVLLEDGGMKFDGEVEDAIRYYLDAEDTRFMNDNIIVNNIKWKKDFLSISKILINHSESTAVTIKPNQRELSVLIEGGTEMEMVTDVMLFIKSKEGIPLASLARGHYGGKTILLNKGPFIIETTILLPKYLSRGKFVLDVYLHHPMYEFQMKAPGCAILYVSGSQDDYGRALDADDYGFCGLEVKDE